MPDRFSDPIFGRRIQRRVFRNRIFDEPSGVEQEDEDVEETAENSDGVLEEIQSPLTRIQVCGHPYRPGEYLARCEECSRKAKHPVYVCAQCAITCPITGYALCLRHTKLGPDGRRFSPEGYRIAERMGLFNAPSTQPASPVCAPSRRSLFAKFLEWW